jgi:hypothetical protein
MKSYTAPQAGLFDSKPISASLVPGGDAVQTSAVEQHVAPVEAGPNAFEHKAVPVYEAQAGIALEQGNDPLLPKHGDAADLATGPAAGVVDVPPAVVTGAAGGIVDQVQEHQPPVPVGGDTNALAIDAEARKRIEQALRNDIADELARLEQAEQVQAAAQQEEAEVAAAL